MSGRAACATSTSFFRSRTGAAGGPPRTSKQKQMEREGSGGRLFFRGLQNRSHEKMKLRKRKSALYLSPARSTGRRGGEWGRGDRSRTERSSPQTLSSGSICWAGCLEIALHSRGDSHPCGSQGAFFHVILGRSPRGRVKPA